MRLGWSHSSGPKINTVMNKVILKKKSWGGVAVVDQKLTQLWIRTFWKKNLFSHIVCERFVFWIINDALYCCLDYSLLKCWLPGTRLDDSIWPKLIKMFHVCLQAVIYDLISFLTNDCTFMGIGMWQRVTFVHTYL